MAEIQIDHFEHSAIGFLFLPEAIHQKLPMINSRMKRSPQVKLIRRALGLTQEEFAGRFHIPLGTLRDWEQGAVVPDQSARAYLTVIARDPEAVRKALASVHV
jgi:DNA-binding transcriptional regulator YiaG